MAEPLYGAAADAVRDQLREPSDLAVAVDIARRVLADHAHPDYSDPLAVAHSYQVVAEALRILLHNLGAEPVDEDEAVRRSVDAQFPAVAAFLADEAGEGQ
ncbi:hypothetical protein [Streptomyces sp. NPDC058252]|uniref:hypothetical protein n=1 Tax=Streptomyces sp. NPDC058252 TaxID=3346405 RepID=UPI0036E6CDF6